MMDEVAAAAAAEAEEVVVAAVEVGGGGGGGGGGGDVLPVESVSVRSPLGRSGCLAFVDWSMIVPLGVASSCSTGF